MANGWRGCTDVFMRSHGDWGDPDLVIEKDGDTYVFNYWDIEDALWDDFCNREGYDSTEVEDNPAVEEEFNQYCQAEAYDYLVDCIYSGYFGDGEETMWDPYEEEYTWHYAYLPDKKKSMEYELSWRGVMDSDWYSKFADRVTRIGKVYYFDGKEIGDAMTLQEYIDDNFGDWD